MHNSRIDHLERLPDKHLFDVARNEAAVHRKAAIEILVERASPFAGRNEIAVEAKQFVLDHPHILKNIDPASATFTPQFPGVVGCLAQSGRPDQTIGYYLECALPDEEPILDLVNNPDYRQVCDSAVWTVWETITDDYHPTSQRPQRDLLP